MKLTLDTILSYCHLNIEVNGVWQDTIVELDTETGKARRYKKDEEGKLERNGDDLILEDVTFPLNKLHVYLVKPE
jgi:hypothetical protein